METTNFEEDITIMYKTAGSFPEGVMAAHEALHAFVPFSTDRKYYGVSRPENGYSIVYRAAAEELSPGEAASLQLDTLVLKKGRYISLTIEDFMKDVQSVGRAFRELLEQPGIDPQGYCVELYYNEKDVKCMIRLED
ncbi:transcriptional regulator [Emticicia sp. CRIBPO]|uniref:transcriptional regulator n=1 Tax=Emticicia sp. CRIBPO TaxID=2683258 RepID=UPI001412A906|nr:transcriptional regulator [Emticicia sp. CRIBPO]NBA86482.1 transcriptional regulator [Emticicia sp. CRIBPO]